MKILLKITGVLLTLAIFVGTLFFLYNKSREKPVIYKTMSPFVTTIIKKAVAIGAVVPRNEIEIKPQVSGVVEEIYVEAGDMLKKRDLIAKVRIIPDMVNLNMAESRLNQAKIKVKDAKRSWERRKNLFERGIISASEIEAYELAYSSAEEELTAAESNLQLIREGIAKSLGEATNTLIRSTIAGMVLDIPVEIGNFVIETNTFNAGTTIATVADMGEMIFKGQVDESEVGKIKLGMDLILIIGAIENENFDAKLEYISPKGKEDKGAIQFEIKASVRLKESHFIRAGYSANADIVLDRRDNVLAIDERVLRFEGDSVFVEVETESQTFEIRRIEVGLSDGINVEVVSGLDQKDKIKDSAAPGKK